MTQIYDEEDAHLPKQVISTGLIESKARIRKRRIGSPKRSKSDKTQVQLGILNCFRIRYLIV